MTPAPAPGRGGQEPEEATGAPEVIPLPEWCRAEFPELEELWLGLRPGSYSIPHDFDGTAAHAHVVGEGKGVICINPRAWAWAWHPHYPTPTFLHEYAHIICQDPPCFDDEGHNPAWRGEFISLLEKYGYPLIHRGTVQEYRDYHLGDAGTGRTWTPQPSAQATRLFREKWPITPDPSPDEGLILLGALAIGVALVWRARRRRIKRRLFI